MLVTILQTLVLGRGLNWRRKHTGIEITIAANKTGHMVQNNVNTFKQL